MSALGPGAFVAVVGASGVGKDSLIDYAKARCDATLVRRVSTRPPGDGEVHQPVSVAEFEARCARGEFAVRWTAHGLRYDIPHTSTMPCGPDAPSSPTCHAVCSRSWRHAMHGWPRAGERVRPGAPSAPAGPRTRIGATSPTAWHDPTRHPSTVATSSSTTTALSTMPATSSCECYARFPTPCRPSVTPD